MEIGELCKQPLTGRLVARPRDADERVLAQLYEICCRVQPSRTLGSEVVNDFEAGEIDRALPRFQQHGQRFARGIVFECRELGLARCRAAARGRRKWIQHEPTSERACGGLISEYETITA